MEKRLTGLRALVTGATAGIGLASVWRLAREGAEVIVASRNETKVNALVDQLHADGFAASAMVFNAEWTPERLQTIVHEEVRRNGPIDIAVNNVGGTDMRLDGPAAELSLEELQPVVDKNIGSTLAVIRAVLPGMIEKGKSDTTSSYTGSIINIASIGGITGDFRGTLYGIAKAGVINLTRYVATQYGKDSVRCNAIAPGLVLTPAAENNLPEDTRRIFLRHNALPYFGKPEDIAGTVAFLASDDSRYITGQTIVADGGLTCHNATIADLTMK